VEVGERTPAGGIRVRFSAPVAEVTARYGRVPLPPYIREPLADPERYQTVYARVTGSAAAPTAGLHFTPGLLDALAAMGVRFAFVTLHVGPDTFRPVRAERIVEHPMHAEFVSVPDATAAAVAAARRAGRRVVAIGTTVVRALESWAGPLGWSGWTRLFIYPGYRFRVVDALVTNFHLPRSTLLMLVSAFAGRELVRRAYEEAISREYRFYSFGDCCLIL
jgi:S-adenosylmethionine:tRNA ribosyltransferase-isomerase